MLIFAQKKGRMAVHLMTVRKEAVYEEVAKTSSYTGAKMEEGSAYERIFTTREDREMLERFWNESKNAVACAMKKFLVSEEERDGVYELTLDFSASFDESLLKSMESSLFSFFVMSIVGKWYSFCNKEEASDYASGATTTLDDILRKAFYKRKPTRPRYD